MKRCLLVSVALCSLFLAPCSYAQTCAIAQTTGASGSYNTVYAASGATKLSQKIKNIDGVAQTICKVSIQVASGTNTVRADVRSAPNGGGTLYGSSDAVSVTAGFRDISFSTPAVTTSADFWVTIIITSYDGTIGFGIRTSASSGYYGTSYPYDKNGTTTTSEVLNMKVWTTRVSTCSWSGNTGTVASPFGSTNVKDCIDDASTKSGAVLIQIPDSSASWAQSVAVDMRSSSFTNVTSLTIRGEHDCTLNTSEIATGIPTSCGTNITAGAAISLLGLTNKKFRLAHLRITGATSGNILNVDGDSAYSAGGGWRVDHVFFDNATPSNRFIYFNRNSSAYGLSDGVIDHCYVLNLPSNIHFLQYQPAVADGGNKEWMSPLGLGTSAAIYFEDNKLYNTTGGNQAWAESQGGGRFVVRHNVCHNGYFDAHDAIVNSLRGVRKYEIYDNTIVYDSSASFTPFLQLRGGSGVFFNNIITNSVYSYIGTPQVAIYRFHQAGGNPWQFAPNASSPAYTKAFLDTSSTYPLNCTSGTGCIDIDGPGGIPARDQLGVDGNNPQVRGAAPLLEWNNTYNGTTHVSPLVTNGYGQAQMIAGTDYCVAADWATMPATCNGITTTYVPFAYPHPATVTTGRIIYLSAAPPYNNNFGDVIQNQSIQRAVRVKNLGASLLTISSVSGFTSVVTGSTSGFTVAADPTAFHDVDITAAPTSLGAFSCTLTFSGDQTGGLNTITFTGNSVAPIPTPTPASGGSRKAASRRRP